MGKHKENLIFVVFAALFLNTPVLWAESKEDNLHRSNETLISNSGLQDIQLEQSQLYRIEKNQALAEGRETSGKGKSILNLSQSKTILPPSLPSLPKTSSGAIKPGWKVKTIKTPQPVSSLIKEVPLEIKAKMARAKDKDSQRKAKGNPKQQRK